MRRSIKINDVEWSLLFTERTVLAGPNFMVKVVELAS